jgi:hypothetical protein
MKIACNRCGSDLIRMGGSMDTMGKNCTQLVEPCQVCMTNHIVGANKKVGPEWNKEGNPLNLQAAAEDAHEWLVFISSKHPASKNCRQELRKFLYLERYGDCPSNHIPD